jgi:hypothetical protein
VSILFAAFLGYNPVQHLVDPHVLAALPAHSHAVVTGHTFFPTLIAGPFHDGLRAAFGFAMAACLVAAAASAMRGGRTPAHVLAGGADDRVEMGMPGGRVAEEQHAA